MQEERERERTYEKREREREREKEKESRGERKKGKQNGGITKHRSKEMTGAVRQKRKQTCVWCVSTGGAGTRRKQNEH